MSDSVSTMRRGFRCAPPECRDPTTAKLVDGDASDHGQTIENMDHGRPLRGADGGEAACALKCPRRYTGGCLRVAQVPGTSVGTKSGWVTSRTTCIPKMGGLI